VISTEVFYTIKLKNYTYLQSMQSSYSFKTTTATSCSNAESNANLYSA